MIINQSTNQIDWKNRKNIFLGCCRNNLVNQLKFLKYRQQLIKFDGRKEILQNLFVLRLPKLSLVDLVHKFTSHGPLIWVDWQLQFFQLFITFQCCCCCVSFIPSTALWSTKELWGNGNNLWHLPVIYVCSFCGALRKETRETAINTLRNSHNFLKRSSLDASKETTEWRLAVK